MFKKTRFSKIALFLACVAPVLYVLRRAWNQDLTANPIEYITHFTGDWTIRLILATLAITPLRRLLNRPGLIRYRRMTGLFAFFYGSLHFLTYIWLDKFFAMGEIVKDVGKRPFITAGFTAFACLVPLAATSTAGWIRRLGGKRWQRLHRLVYFSAVAAVVHYYWLVKADHRLPLMYAAIAAVLLGYRMWGKLMSRAPVAGGARKDRTPYQGTASTGPVTRSGY